MLSKKESFDERLSEIGCELSKRRSLGESELKTKQNKTKQNKTKQNKKKKQNKTKQNKTKQKTKKKNGVDG